MLPVSSLVPIIGSVVHGANALLEWLLTYAIHSTLLIGGLLLLTATAAGRRLVDGHGSWLWRFALVGAVVTASLQSIRAESPLAGTLRLDRDTPARTVVRMEVKEDVTVSSIAPASPRALRWSSSDRQHRIVSSSIQVRPIWPLVVLGAWLVIAALLTTWFLVARCAIPALHRPATLGGSHAGRQRIALPARRRSHRSRCPAHALRPPDESRRTRRRRDLPAVARIGRARPGEDGEHPRARARAPGASRPDLADDRAIDRGDLLLPAAQHPRAPTHAGGGGIRQRCVGVHARRPAARPRALPGEGCRVDDRGTATARARDGGTAWKVARASRRAPDDWSGDSRGNARTGRAPGGCRGDCCVGVPGTSRGSRRRSPRGRRVRGPRRNDS